MRECIGTTPLRLAGNDSSKLRWLGTFAEQSGADEIALRAFQRLAQSPGDPSLALAGQQRLAVKMHDISASRTIAEKTVSPSGRPEFHRGASESHHSQKP